MHNDLLERILKEYKERDKGDVEKFSEYTLEDLKADAIKFNCVENLVKHKCKNEEVTALFSYNRLNNFRTQLIIIRSNMTSPEERNIQFSSKTFSIDYIIDYASQISWHMFKESPYPYLLSEGGI